MAIDLDVLPTLPPPIRWGELKRIIHSTSPDAEVRCLVETIAIFDRRSKQRVGDAEALACAGYYYFGSDQNMSALSLSLEPNQGGEEDADYFEDFSRNLPPDIKELIRGQWQAAGYSVSVSSNTGRARNELNLLTFVASCIAKVTSGFVVVKENDFFNQPVGIYAPYEVSYRSQVGARSQKSDAG